VALVCNDEGKLLNLPPNRLLRDENGQPYDILCGTFFVVGLGKEDFKSLTPQQIRRYSDLFAGDKLLAIHKTYGKDQKNHER
jgi:hypothetical protein